MKIISILMLLAVFSSEAFACGAEDKQTDLSEFLDSVGDSFYYQKDGLCPRVESHSKALYERLTEGEVLAIHAYTENGFYKESTALYGQESPRQQIKRSTHQSLT